MLELFNYTFGYGSAIVLAGLRALTFSLVLLALFRSFANGRSRLQVMSLALLAVAIFLALGNSVFYKTPLNLVQLLTHVSLSLLMVSLARSREPVRLFEKRSQRYRGVVNRPLSHDNQF